jgi:hypothetical protein
MAIKKNEQAQQNPKTGDLLLRRPQTGRPAFLASSARPIRPQKTPGLVLCTSPQGKTRLNRAVTKLQD